VNVYITLLRMVSRVKTSLRKDLPNIVDSYFMQMWCNHMKEKLLRELSDIHTTFETVVHYIVCKSLLS
jgi:hypothetical protein